MNCAVVAIDQGDSNTISAVSDGGIVTIFNEIAPNGRYPSQLFFGKDSVDFGSNATAGGNRDPVNFVKNWK